MNTRVRLAELSQARGRRATLDDIPDADLDELRRLGFDWLWLLGVWQTGPASRRVSLAVPELRREYAHVLPDLTDDDIVGSCFAVRRYAVRADFGGDEALARLRERARARGLRLMLDFVPNHTALDHDWVTTHPEFYVSGTEIDLARAPANYTRVETGRGPALLAHGRDPYFPGWTDTLQLDYANPTLRAAMADELVQVAARCDGVRCDMAMLVLPAVFERTWGIAAEPFWPEAIPRVREQHPGFCFMAEVYWDLEWTLQQQGFDYTYDKRLYDRLRHEGARAVREHLGAGLDFQDRLARFLENHDEPRAAATFPPAMHEAAAVVTYLAPGLRFVHQGQMEGRRVRVPVHLGRGPVEPVDAGLRDFYERLLGCMRERVVRTGTWRLLDCVPAWGGNWTHDGFVAFAWDGPDAERRLVVVNYAPNQSQCYMRLPWADLAGKSVRLEDLMGGASYDRAGGDLVERGLYLDLAPWGYHVFAVRAS
jgi:hypothetical protein